MSLKCAFVLAVTVDTETGELSATATTLPFEGLQEDNENEFVIERKMFRCNRDGMNDMST